MSNELAEQVKLWLQCENNIKAINTKLKSIKDKKIKLENNIIDILKTNGLENKKIKLNNSYIICNNNFQLIPLSYKFLDSTINEYFNNSEESKKICEFLKTKRDSNKKEKFSLKQII